MSVNPRKIFDKINQTKKIVSLQKESKQNIDHKYVCCAYEN
jgi:hypothetical protein